MGLRRSDKVDARLTLTDVSIPKASTASAHIEPAKSFLELSNATYVPRASTPLLDAIGHAIADIDKVELRPDEKIGLVILTDGHENASKEHTKDSIRKMLTDRQDNKGWLVTFLGADIDGFRRCGRDRRQRRKLSGAEEKPAQLRDELGACLADALRDQRPESGRRFSRRKNATTAQKD